MIRALLIVSVLAAAARAERIPCFGKDRGNPGCELTRMEGPKSEIHPWFKCCKEDQRPSGMMMCRPGFEMYATTRHCAVACAATKKELAESAACYSRYLNAKVEPIRNRRTR